MKKVFSLILVFTMVTSVFSFVSNAQAVGQFETNDDGAVIIPFAEQSPIIDGQISENEWAGAAEFTIDFDTASFVIDGKTTYPNTAKQPKASGTFYYLWNYDGLYVYADIKDTTTAWTSNYLENNNTYVDGIQITLDPFNVNESGQKAIITASPVSSYSGNGNITGSKNPDLNKGPYWTELWGFLPEYGTTQDAIEIASTADRYDPTLQDPTQYDIESPSTQVKAYRIEMRITDDFFNYKPDETGTFLFLSGTQLKMTNFIIDYWNTLAGKMKIGCGTDTYQKLNALIGDCNWDALDNENHGMSNSDNWTLIEFGSNQYEDRAKAIYDKMTAIYDTVVGTGNFQDTKTFERAYLFLGSALTDGVFGGVNEMVEVADNMEKAYNELVPIVSSIEVALDNTKKDYNAGESIDLINTVIIGKNEKTPKGFNVTDFCTYEYDFLKPGTQTVIVKLGEKQTSFNVEVINKTILKGDIDANSKIELSDAMKSFQHVAGKITLEGDAFTAADIDCDNKVALNDAMKIFQCVAGKISVDDLQPKG
ncbi:MAG: hypothetical protein DBX47_03700 [Clostridiales bacterium]|nr:MAG: hypothetical protein DBX47_03700 [Clostridiales bacterium]